MKFPRVILTAPNTVPATIAVAAGAGTSPTVAISVVVFSPANTTASTHTDRVYISTQAAGAFTFAARVALTASTVYVWNYVVMGY